MCDSQQYKGRESAATKLVAERLRDLGDEIQAKYSSVTFQRYTKDLVRIACISQIILTFIVIIKR